MGNRNEAAGNVAVAFLSGLASAGGVAMAFLGGLTIGAVAGFVVGSAKRQGITGDRASRGPSSG